VEGSVGKIVKQGTLVSPNPSGMHEDP